MEIWDLYTEKREATGKIHLRGEKIPDDLYHLVVHVWIKNSEGKYLISQRSANRPSFPLMWECVGGSVLKGESSIQGALRETKEEIGVDLSVEKGKLVFSKVRKQINGKKFNDILDVWLFEYDGAASLNNATTDEVSQVVWMDSKQIIDLSEQGKLVETLNYFFTEVDK
ncbi:MAG: NUDIX domain-containing protein [Clostridia bacterium]|nr:NUDIX domain-containing protein [Clostridia bacterium]